MVKKFFTLVLLTSISCSTGYLDKYGVHRPKRPSYQLKNKKGDIIPIELDILNLYRYYGYYIGGKLVKNKFRDPDWNIYEKFNSNGRAYSFGTNNLKESDLDPNYGSKGYFVFDKKNNIIKYEVFTNGNGGQYVIIKYMLNKTGDTLTSLHRNKKYQVYVKEKIPSNWKKYESNW